MGALSQIRKINIFQLYIVNKDVEPNIECCSETSYEFSKIAILPKKITCQNFQINANIYKTNRRR